jgi:SAM-dependent methyltransferase
MRQNSFPINREDERYFFDIVTVEPSGVIRVVGWSKSDVIWPKEELCLKVNGNVMAPDAAFHVVRPDIASCIRPATGLGENPLCGFMIEFHCLDLQISSLELIFADQTIFRADLSYQTVEPGFKELLSTDRVFHRADIYTSATLPPLDVNDDILQISTQLNGRILDFGCGRGALLRALRQRGLDAVGLEIENPVLRQSLAEGVEPHVTYYDGSLPLPFGDLEFDSTIAAEVIEHIRDFEQVVAEIARITRGLFIVSVPDFSAIPLCFPHYCVPWHVLEGDHRNFFTQRSLEKLLASHFPSVEMFRICPRDVNGTIFYTSLAAVARK